MIFLGESRMEDDEKKITFSEFLDGGATKDLYGKLKYTDFIDRLEKAAVDEVLRIRQQHIFENIFSEKENEKRFKKQLRQNSKKYHKKIMKIASCSCELCNWSMGQHSLHVHHIKPISEYWYQYYQKKTVPGKDFEISNLVVLCPNCHTAIHLIQKQSNLDNQYDYISSLFEQTEIADNLIDKFVNIINKKPITRHGQANLFTQKIE